MASFSNNHNWSYTFLNPCALLGFSGLWIIFWTLLFLLTVKSWGIIIIRTFIIMQKVLQYVSMPPWSSRLAGKNVKSKISHQCWRGWRCDYTSKYFHFLRNRTLRINDVGIFSPIEMNILQLQISQTSPSKEANILMKISNSSVSWYTSLPKDVWNLLIFHFYY